METNATQYNNMIFAPASVPDTKQKKVFLAGSIEKQVEIDWQSRIAEALKNENILLLNPTRFTWDSSWKTTADDAQFNEQVSWELEQLEKADLIILNLLPEAQSPISLLEFGLYAQSGKLIVCCPDGFWKKGNVDMVCRRYHVPQVKDVSELAEIIKQNLRETL
jgi:hypothetical protein